MDKKPVGSIYTPLKWAKWVIRRWNLHHPWAAGARILDPTAGEGVFLLALIQTAQEEGLEITPAMVDSLFAIEIHPPNAAQMRALLLAETGHAPPEKNLVNFDFFEIPPNFAGAPFDLILGNPPWINFNDLPFEQKETLKPHFHRYGLVPDSRALLYGRSRVDLAALVTLRAVIDFLKPGGEMHFFLPLSLLLNDGAHEGFRKFGLGDVSFAVTEVHDFQHEDIFGGVGTRYGLVSFRRDSHIHYPVPYYLLESDGSWTKKGAAPSGDAVASWSIDGTSVQKRLLCAHSRPRQGFNTAGANELFIFDQIKPFSEHMVEGINRHGIAAILPAELVYPVPGRKNFEQGGAETAPEKFVFIPHDRQTGKPLSLAALKRYPEACSYLFTHAEKLRHRKGVMIQTQIKKGLFWALLGVGPYNFAPWKLVWEAYGRKNFSPVLLPGDWQANQALQGFMPFWDLAQAEAVLGFLQTPEIEQSLKSHGMTGTRSWAQPGRIGRFFEMGECGLF